MYEPKHMLCENLEGWGREGGGGEFRREGSHVCLWLIHAEAHLYGYKINRYVTYLFDYSDMLQLCHG